eukprot:TRINITY_DN2971_c0_g1_i1.p2 TRINITY_DN2971_c0_g1~~TRINITY_DN2971_c0_g1_i1.p2  ORF type:complete len:287 (+),score=30.10 TRINITY_DN2971_c0_g1_i1:33-893(+)
MKLARLCSKRLFSTHAQQTIRVGDPALNNQIRQLLGVDAMKRDLAWRRQFFGLVPFADFQVSQPNRPILNGPDGLPYFFLKSVDIASSSSSVDSKQAKDLASIETLTPTLLKSGCGMAIDVQNGPNKQFIFSFGDVWCRKEFGKYDADSPLEANIDNRQQTKVQVSAGTQILYGIPNEKLFPSYARTQVRNFLTDDLKLKNRTDREVYVVTIPGQNPMILVPLIREEFSDARAFQFATQRLQFFFPKPFKLTLWPRALWESVIWKTEARKSEGIQKIMNVSNSTAI